VTESDAHGDEPERLVSAVSPAIAINRYAVTLQSARYREKTQSSYCMPHKAQVSKTLERLKIRSRWCRLEVIKPDM
jgi:hypothetical protein